MLELFHVWHAASTTCQVPCSINAYHHPSSIGFWRNFWVLSVICSTIQSLCTMGRPRPSLVSPWRKPLLRLTNRHPLVPRVPLFSVNSHWNPLSKLCRYPPTLWLRIESSLLDKSLLEYAIWTSSYVREEVRTLGAFVLSRLGSRIWVFSCEVRITIPLWILRLTNVTVMVILI
jgi:hypothetical protein